MPHSFVERELKFDVDPQFTLLDIDDVVPPGGRLELANEQLRSDYFDTAEHALLRAHMTLRRRTGSTDVGWQLKIPHEQFREEIRADLDGDSLEVPAELQRLLVGTLAGRPLQLVATLTTERAVTRLLDADGRPLAEIDDDTVHASVPGESGMTAMSWHEVEVELGEGDVELLSTVGKRLRRAGARASVSASKLGRALGGPQPAASPPTGSRASAGDVVAEYVTEQQRAMLAGDLALRRGNDSVIHPTRVATRRLRSTLRVFGRLFDGARAAALDAELRWYAGLLGDVRDRHVLRRRLDAMVADLDETVLLGPVKARIDSELTREEAEHWATLTAELDGERYLNLLRGIAEWVREPPVTPAAAKPAAVVADLVRKAERTVARRLAAGNASGDVHQLHQARKAAKRARYAAEAGRPVIGKKAAKAEAKRYRTLQDLLGEHQDSVLSAEFLRRLGAKAGTTPGENGFAFGVLWQRELDNARTARAAARKTARRYV